MVYNTEFRKCPDYEENQQIPSDERDLSEEFLIDLLCESEVLAKFALLCVLQQMLHIKREWFLDGSAVHTSGHLQPCMCIGIPSNAVNKLTLMLNVRGNAVRSLVLVHI